jgi:hypothetical protein
MTIVAMRHLGLKIDRPTLVTLKMVNKQIVRPERVMNGVAIIIMRVSTIVDFYVVLEEDGAYLIILDRPWLTKSHAKNYWGERYMTIRVRSNRHKVPFANFVKNFKGTNEYDDESETYQRSSSKGIYIDDSNEEEVPKVKVLSQANQKV